MRRLAAFVVAFLVALVIADHRLSDGERHPSTRWFPELWEADHHGDAAVSAHPCARVMMLSLNPQSPYALTSIDRGVRFDIDADGDLDRVAWTERGSDVAFLALDRDLDGRITSGSELIGDRMVPAVTNAPNALMSLAYAAAGGATAQTIDSRSPLFARLLLWTDVNHNGISEPRELRPAQDVVSHVGLGYQRHHRKDRHGNQSRYRGFVSIRTALGPNEVRSADDNSRRTRSMYEVCLETG
jgi:hypothetical protein